MAPTLAGLEDVRMQETLKRTEPASESGSVKMAGNAAFLHVMSLAYAKAFGKPPESKRRIEGTTAFKQVLLTSCVCASATMPKV